MDQIKIGKFIASCRKEQGMTQASLAEKLGISDRAVSKWETGKSMPDSGIMLVLCALLKINVNELLSGERIMAEAYDKRAEENLLAMRMPELPPQICSYILADKSRYAYGADEIHEMPRMRKTKLAEKSPHQGRCGGVGI